MDDLISRQSAIDTLKRHLKETDVPYSYPGLLSAIEDWLDERELPSAEPEIIHCRDCKWYHSTGCTIQIVDQTTAPKDDDFCFFAERKESTTSDCISRQAAIDLAEEVETKRLKGEIDLTYAPMVKGLTQLPPAQPEYEPVKAEDFAKTMSENTLYSYIAWHGEALALMERQGFVICKKKM